MFFPRFSVPGTAQHKYCTDNTFGFVAMRFGSGYGLDSCCLFFLGGCSGMSGDMLECVHYSCAGIDSCCCFLRCFYNMLFRHVSFRHAVC